MREREHVLQLENITMQFGGVVAVNNLSIHFATALAIVKSD